MESNDSPEISDRAETSDIPGLPSRANMGADRLLTPPSDTVLCLMKIPKARFLSDIRHCPTVMSKSVCRTTVLVVGWGLHASEGAVTGVV